MSVMLDRDKIENITKQVKALGAEFVRQYRTEFLRHCRSDFARRDRITTALDIAHEKARQCFQNSLPARPQVRSEGDAARSITRGLGALIRARSAFAVKLFRALLTSRLYRNQTGSFEIFRLQG